MQGLIVILNEVAQGSQPKLFLEKLFNVPVFVRSIVAAFPKDRSVHGVFVAPEEYHEEIQAILKEYALDEIDHLVASGENYYASVAHAFDAFEVQPEQIIIQDAMQALTPRNLVDDLLEQSEAHTLCLPLLEIESNYFVFENEKLINAAKQQVLYQSQGPFVIDAERLKAHLISDEQEGTSEQAFLNALLADNNKVKILAGDSDNQRLLTTADISRAMECYSRRAIDYIFVYPPELLPKDPLLDILLPLETEAEEFKATTELSAEETSEEASSQISEERE